MPDFLPNNFISSKKAIQRQFRHDQPLYLFIFLPVSRHFGGKQAHWHYASRYFSPISRLLNAASKCNRLLFLARPR